MPRIELVKVALFVVAALTLSACREATAPTAKVEPFSKEKVADTDLYRLTLTERAIERLDVQTAEVTVSESGALLLPYAALLYDLNGQTWTYVSPEERVFVRQQITVSAIEGEQVVMSDGPAAGSRVVSVAAAELYGAETGIGK